MHCYCLFCETNRASRIAQLINLVHHIHTISPTIMQREIKQGKVREIQRNWLPGYIFLYTEEPIFPWFEFSGIIRWVGRGELEGQDLAFAQTLLDQGGILNAVKVVEVGDCCVVADPVWNKLKGTIVKLDRGRKRCCISYIFDHEQRTVWVGYDLVKPTENINA